MLPAGGPTETTIEELGRIAGAGAIIIDGGNSFYKDDIRRAKSLAALGVDYVDVGTSGGVWGLERGFCMMIGGREEIVRRLDPIFDALAPGFGDIARTPGRDRPDDRAERGYIHAGPPGAGHFVKMVHNGIEYGLMQAYAEGFDILKGKASEPLPEEERFTIDLPDVAEVWRRGSVISSWLLDLTAAALARDHDLEGIQRQRRRQWRGTLGTRRGDGGGGACLCDLGGALCALSQPGRIDVRRQIALGDALRFRRPCRDPAMSAAGSKPAPPATLVIFGVTGDLARRLLVPALVNLRREGLITDGLNILGIGKQDLDDEALRHALAEFVDAGDPVWKKLRGRISYLQGRLRRRGDLSGARRRASDRAMPLSISQRLRTFSARSRTAWRLITFSTRIEGRFRRL